jgi:hypothetical protein
MVSFLLDITRRLTVLKLRMAKRLASMVEKPGARHDWAMNLTYE